MAGYQHYAIIAALVAAASPLSAALARVEVSLIAPNQADAATVTAALSTFLVGKSVVACSPREPLVHPVAALNDNDQWEVKASLCFVIRSEAEAWSADIQAKWTGGSLRTRILIGSSVSFHMCSHADATIYPSRDPRGEFSGAVK